MGAWLVRACVTGEPPAARAITAAAAGSARSHLACVLTGFLATTVLGFTGTVVVTAVSARSSNDHSIAVATGPALTAGLVTTLVCALLGTAVGVLGNRPVLCKPGWSVPVTGLGVLFVLVASGSPANAAVSGLSAGSARGVAEMPLLPLAVAGAVAVAATALACRLARRH